MEYQDYYDTLGVDRSASKEEISKAYRKLARQYHPDVNQGPKAEDKFKEINEAHAVLKDPETRQRYDALGANWKAGQQFQPPPDWAEMFSSYGNGGSGSMQFNFGGDGGAAHSDFFDALFGSSGMFENAGGSGDAFSQFRGTQSGYQGASAQKGSNREADITITIRDAYHGASRQISLSTPEVGFLANKKKSFQIKIPAGTISGKKIRLGGQGEPSPNGGAPGDLLLNVRVAPDPTFTPVGSDIVAKLPLTPWEAAMGAKVEVETLDGNVQLSIPAGTQSGQRLRLKGKGFPMSESKKGDMYAEVSIVVPKKLSKKEKELFKKLSEVSKFQPRKK